MLQNNYAGSHSEACCRGSTCRHAPILQPISWPRILPQSSSVWSDQIHRGWARKMHGGLGCRGGVKMYKWNTQLDRNDVSLPSHRWTNGWQPLKNIVTNGWLTDKPSKNHWSQWLSRYHSINGNGHLKNHWFLAMVVNFLPLCLAEADIKQTNDSFCKIKNIFL